ncbi:hypothetical protein DITRI_Ditri15bG0069400 [Diplodiscus trichospermus]
MSHFSSSFFLTEREIFLLEKKEKKGSDRLINGELRKPIFFANCVGENTGEDIFERPNDGSCTYQGRMEVLQPDLNQDQSKQIGVTEVSGKEPHQALRECSLPEAPTVSNVAPDKAEKKRKIDKAYRERCKMRQLEMKKNLDTLGEENKLLKKKNESLKGKNTQMLQSQAEELNKQKEILSDLAMRQLEMTKNLDTLGEENKLLKKENESLKYKNAQMLQSQAEELNKQKDLLSDLAMRQLEMTKNLETLGEENKFLKKENESLKDKYVYVTQMLKLNKHKEILSDNAVVPEC